MQDNKISAGTQYNDLNGNVAIDEHTDSSLFEFAKQNGVDTGEYFPISIGFYKEGDFESVTIDAVDAVNVASSLDGLEEYMTSSPGLLPVKRFKLDVSLNDYLNFIKRFSFVATINAKLIGKEISIQDRKLQ